MQSLIEQKARMMWIVAHPDDESMGGGVLAKAGPGLGNPLYFLVLTHGEGGECRVPGGCPPDLATFRKAEMEKVARLYGAELQMESFFNAPLPTESFPKRSELAKVWKKHKDPEVVCAKAIRKFKPDVILTFDPDHGFTGHPEHQLVSRFATAAVRLAAAETAELGKSKAHLCPHVFYIKNLYLPFTLFGAGDPGPYSEAFDVTQACTDKQSCREVMAEFTKPHRSQAADMQQVRRLCKVIRRMYLYRADPFTEIKDPYQPEN